MKKDTYYFSHDYNAKNDIKILLMRQELGMEGYGIYWFLIEALAESGGILPFNIIPVLAKQMDTTEVKVKGVITKYELFQLNDTQFFSERLLKHLELRNAMSEAGRIGAKNRWKNGGANGGAIRGANAKERKVKEIKVKEKSNTHDLSNSNLFRQPIIPNEKEVEQFFITSGGTKEMSKIFFEKNAATGWFLKGSPITNFRYLVPSFISNFKQNAKPNTSEARYQARVDYANRHTKKSEERDIDFPML